MRREYSGQLMVVKTLLSDTHAHGRLAPPWILDHSRKRPEGAAREQDVGGFALTRAADDPQETIYGWGPLPRQP